MHDVITFGEPLVLFTPQSPGLLRHQAEFHKSVGGTELNTAIGLARLGVSAGWFGRVGDDEFGSEVIAVLQSEGVDTKYVSRDKTHPTAVMFKQYRGFGDVQVLYYRSNSAAREITPAMVPVDYIREAKFLHLTGITAAISESANATVMHSIKLAKSFGVRVSFDPNVRLRFMDPKHLDTLMLPIIKETSVLLLGVEEGQLIFHVEGAKDVARAAHAAGVSIVAVKMGADGSYISTPDESFTQPGVVVRNVVDTVGAGDGYNAGFLAGLCRGESIRQAAALASITGAYAVTVQSDYEGYPTWEEAVSHLRGDEQVSR